MAHHPTADFTSSDGGGLSGFCLAIDLMTATDWGCSDEIRHRAGLRIKRIAVRRGDMLVQVAAYDDVSLRRLPGRSAKLIFCRFLLARPALEDNFGPLPSAMHGGGNNVLLLLGWPGLILPLLHGWHIRRCHWLRIEHAQRRRMCMAAPMADVGRCARSSRRQSRLPPYPTRI